MLLTKENSWMKTYKVFEESLEEKIKTTFETYATNAMYFLKEDVYHNLNFFKKVLIFFLTQSGDVRKICLKIDFDEFVECWNCKEKYFSKNYFKSYFKQKQSWSKN